jgi:hypothetical protein
MTGTFDAPELAGCLVLLDIRWLGLVGAAVVLETLKQAILKTRKLH